MSVFFDDILIYNKSWEEYVQHFDRVLQLVKEKQLYGKISKCLFGVYKIEYFDHIVSYEGVKTNPKKIKYVMDRPIHKTFNNHRGFIDFIRYNCKFV